MTKKQTISITVDQHNMYLNEIMFTVFDSALQVLLKDTFTIYCKCNSEDNFSHKLLKLLLKTELKQYYKMVWLKSCHHCLNKVQTRWAHAIENSTKVLEKENIENISKD